MLLKSQLVILTVLKPLDSKNKLAPDVKTEVLLQPVKSKLQPPVAPGDNLTNFSKHLSCCSTCCS